MYNLWCVSPWLLVLVLWSTLPHVDTAQTPTEDCLDDGNGCVSDQLGLEAIKQLHILMDDDHNGNLDKAESIEFFRDELKHSDGSARQATFHGTDDLISINDLWELWTISEVYNWTVDEVIQWLEEDVSLPRYSESFRVNEVNGHILPRIAVNSQYVTSILGIKNPVHRQKLSIKATDLVLFGYKKRGHTWINALLVCLLVVALTVAWLARRENSRSREHIRKVMAELDSLQRSDDSVKQLQRRYEETQREHQEAALSKQQLEKKLEEEVTAAKSEAERLRQTREVTEEEISRLKLAELELVEVHKALADAERRCEEMSLGVPQLNQLQQWLQLTYEIETQFYDMKRESAEKHLHVAREMCERIRKKRGGLFGSLRMAHSTSLDDTDHSIMKARGALEEVRLHLQERSQRWRQIEGICDFDIISNLGLHVLETSLRGVGATYLTGPGIVKSPSATTFSTIPVDSDVDDDLSPSELAAYIATESVERPRTLVDVRGGNLRGIARHSRTLPSSLYRSDMTLSEQVEDGHSDVSNGTATPDQVVFSLGDASPSPSSVTSHQNQSKPLESANGTKRPKPLSASQSDVTLRNKENVTQSSSSRNRSSVRSSDSGSVIGEQFSSSESIETNTDLDEFKEKKRTSLKSLFKPKKKKDS